MSAWLDREPSVNLDEIADDLQREQEVLSKSLQEIQQEAGNNYSEGLHVPFGTSAASLGYDEGCSPQSPVLTTPHHRPCYQPQQQQQQQEEKQTGNHRSREAL